MTFWRKVLRLTTYKVTEVKDELMESKATVSLSKISQNEMEKMRKMCYIYRKEKHMEDEATPSSETGPTEARHVSWALNVSQLKESPKWSSCFFGPKKVIWQNSITCQSKTTRLWSRGQLMWKKNSWCWSYEEANGLWRRHGLTTSFASISFYSTHWRRGS